MCPSQLLVSDFLGQVYFQKPRMAGGSPRSRLDYQYQIEHLVRDFRTANNRDMRLPDFSDAAIYSAMRARIEAGVSKDTANKVRAVALAVWNYAHDQYPEIVARPPRRLEKLKCPKRDPECWWQEEFERILAAAAELPGSLGAVSLACFADCLLRVSYNSGARISALMAVEVSWIDLPGRQLCIQAQVQKDGEDQTVKLLPGTVAAIERMRAMGRVRRLFDDWPYDRRCDQWPALNHLLKKLIVAAGLRPDMQSVTRRDLWHKIRRTFATYITMRAGIETAREMLGHSSIEVTKRYIDRSKLGRKSQADLLDDPRMRQLRLFEVG